MRISTFVGSFKFKFPVAGQLRYLEFHLTTVKVLSGDNDPII